MFLALDQTIDLHYKSLERRKARERKRFRRVFLPARRNCSFDYRSLRIYYNFNDCRRCAMRESRWKLFSNELERTWFAVARIQINYGQLAAVRQKLTAEKCAAKNSRSVLIRACLLSILMLINISVDLCKVARSATTRAAFIDSNEAVMTRT